MKLVLSWDRSPAFLHFTCRRRCDERFKLGHWTFRVANCCVGKCWMSLAPLDGQNFQDEHEASSISAELRGPTWECERKRMRRRLTESLKILEVKKRDGDMQTSQKWLWGALLYSGTCRCVVAEIHRRFCDLLGASAIRRRTHRTAMADIFIQCLFTLRTNSTKYDFQVTFQRSSTQYVITLDVP